MRLKQREEARPPHELRVRLDADAYDDLQLYGELYREQYGETIATKTLASEIVRQFLESDKAFRRWKRAHNGASGAATGNGADAQHGIEARQ